MALGTVRRGQINVTPLIDVVLVLLIIFLVVVPVALRGLAVDVPAAAAPGAPAPPEAPVVLSVAATDLDADGRIVTLDIGGVRTTRADLAERLRARLEGATAKVVVVDFDGGTQYAEAIGVVDLAKGVGATQVTLDTSRR
jgi:biopolymer transport protein ExbD